MINIRAFVLFAGSLLAIAATATAEPLLSMPGEFFKSALPAVEKRLRFPVDAPAHVLALSPVTASERSAGTKAAQIRNKHTPLQIGFGREISREAAQIDFSALKWQPMGGGSSAARIVLESPGATSLRAELVLTGDADGVLFRFGGALPGSEVFGPFTWADLQSTSRWSPIIEGASMTIEVELSANAAPAGKSLTVPRISHLEFTGRDLALAQPKAVKASSQSCEIDVACVANPSSDLLNAAASVARMAFTGSSGGSFLCTGSLLNSKDAAGQSTQIPYFITANHCIDDSFAARTANFFWFFEATTCNGASAPNQKITTGGGTLLYTNPDVDVALLRLNTAPPQGVFLAGWDASPVFPATDVIALHHPLGDLKKYSAGRLVDFQHSCAFDSVSGDCAVPLQAQGMYLLIDWLQGLTEGGSSGSGLFTHDVSGEYRLRGVLHAGEVMTCPNPEGYDEFSQFSLAYPAISQYLAGVAQPTAGANAIEYYNVDLDHYFLTSFPTETQFVESGGAGPGWVRTGYSFPVGSAASAPPNASVCRFYGNPLINPITGKRFGPNSHFYTADANECALVRLDPGWTFETPQAFTIKVPIGGTCPVNTIPVMRLYNNGFVSNNSNHRYTTSKAVYQFMLTQNSAPPIASDPATSPVRWTGESTVMCAPVSP